MQILPFHFGAEVRLELSKQVSIFPRITRNWSIQEQFCVRCHSLLLLLFAKFVIVVAAVLAFVVVTVVVIVTIVVVVTIVVNRHQIS